MISITDGGGKGQHTQGDGGWRDRGGHGLGEGQAAGWGGRGSVNSCVTVVNLEGAATRLATRSDGLVAGVAPLPADEVGHQHDQDQAGQGCSHYDGDQHVVLVQLALLS